jgi:outer membrane protein
MLKKFLFSMILVFGASTPFAQELKIGVVNTERILRDSAPAKASQQKLENEFAKRQKEIEDLAARLKMQSERYEKEASVMSESERTRRQRELSDLDRDVQRRQREFREDLNQRRSEEYAALIERANRVIKQMAETEKIDLILQDAVHVSSRIDITDKVIRALNNNK